MHTVAEGFFLTRPAPAKLDRCPARKIVLAARRIKKFYIPLYTETSAVIDGDLYFH